MLILISPVASAGQRGPEGGNQAEIRKDFQESGKKSSNDRGARVREPARARKKKGSDESKAGVKKDGREDVHKSVPPEAKKKSASHG